MTAVLRWETPPEQVLAGRKFHDGKSALKPLAEELRSKPGEWAVVLEGPPGKASAMATHIRLGQVLCFTPTGDFDALTHKAGEHTLVYARYCGEDL